MSANQKRLLEHSCLLHMISSCWRDSHPLEWQLASLHGQNQLTCSTAVCLLSPGADMVSCSIFLASSGILCSADDPKRDLLSLERRHSVTVDQRDLSARMVVHPVHAACGDEVARLDDKVLHANSIRGKSSILNAKRRGSLGRLRAGDPALPPALRPASKVRRGTRSTCAAMRRHAPRIPTCSPCDFCRRTSAGAQVHSSYLCSRLSPQRTFLEEEGWSVWQRGAQSLHVRRTQSTGRCTGERPRSHSCPAFL
jgi:hypothetical protein